MHQKKNAPLKLEKSTLLANRAEWKPPRKTFAQLPRMRVGAATKVTPAHHGTSAPRHHGIFHPVCIPSPDTK